MLYLKFFSVIVLIFFLGGCSSRHTYTSVPSSKSFHQHESSNSSIIDTPNMHRATMRSYSVAGKKYYPAMVSVGDAFSGVASWYGKDFHGKKTSNGEFYNMYDMTAAHKTLPMNTMVKVTHLENGKSLVVRVNDRGPFVKSRIIDLSYTAANRIDMIQKGTAPVRLEIVGFGGIVGDRPGYHSVEGGDFMVQIGAFRRDEGAKSYASAHSNIHGNYNTKVEKGIWNNSPLYRVFLTGFRSEDEARDFIASGVFEGAFIIRDSK